MQWISQPGCAFLVRQRNPVHSSSTHIGKLHRLGQPIRVPLLVFTGLKETGGKMNRLPKCWNHKALDSLSGGLKKKRKKEKKEPNSERQQYAGEPEHSGREPSLIHYALTNVGLWVTSSQQKAFVKRRYNYGECYYFWVLLSDDFKSYLRALTYISPVIFLRRPEPPHCFNRNSLSFV